MTGQYHLIPISLIISLLYGVSYIFSIIGISTPKIHSRIWNFALLISFLFAGLFGIFLVIQINYKIDIPVVETIMLFHVDFGISLFLISVFHILLHLGFFKQMLRGINQADKVEIQKIRIPPASASSQFHYKRKIVLSIFILGFNSMILQIIMLREFISVFTGNELIIGIILSNWLILTGLGAFSFRKELKVYKNSHFFVGLHFILGILPFITLFLLFFLKNTFFPVGIQINYVQLYFFSLFLLAPLCFTYGFAFSSLNNQLSELYDNEMVNKSYSFESFGSLAGGLIFSFLLVFILNSFQILSILLLVNFVALFFYLRQNYNLYGKTLILALIVILFTSTFIVKLESRVKNLLFPSQNLVSVENSPYGQMIITDNSGQLNFFQNGIYVFSTDSGKLGNSTIASDEERVHFTMLQHTDPGHILCISGGISGIVKEILKYNVKSIDLVEIDPIISKLAKKYNPDIKNPEVHLINMDFREFMRKNNSKYDVVFVNMPPPMGTETNRFYTDEFFNSLKKIMKDESIVCLSLPSTVNYIDSISLISNRLIYNTLKNRFRNVCIFPGEKNYFIASDNSIHLNIIERLIKESIQTEYLAYYLDDFSIKSRSEIMMQQIGGPSSLNQEL
jgi:spermidine synthase